MRAPIGVRSRSALVLLPVVFVLVVASAAAADAIAASKPNMPPVMRSTGSAPQTTRVVTNTNDSGAGSLRQVVGDSNPGDTIVFDSHVTGIITVTTWPIVISTSVTISGPGASVLAVSGNYVTTVLKIRLGSGDTGTVTISDLTVRDGPYLITYGYGAIENYLGTLLLDRIVIGSSGNSGALSNGRDPPIPNNLFGRFPTVDVWHHPLAPCLGSVGFVNWNGNTTIRNSTIAYTWEGIATFFGTVFLENVTVSGGYPYGVVNGNDYPWCPLKTSVMVMKNSTILAGVRNSIGSTFSIGNSILTTCEGYSPITSLGHNLSSSCNLAAPGDITSTNFLLAPLGNYGGPTPTFNLLPGSPAIDAGDNSMCPATDQRGVARPIDGNKDGVATCDIGAVEFFSVTNTVNLPLIMR